MEVNNTEDELKKQIKKWTEKIVAERKRIILADGKKESLLDNMDAYISDSSHFWSRKDYIRSFECLVYAWGILETLKELGIITKKSNEIPM